MHSGGKINKRSGPRGGFDSSRGEVGRPFSDVNRKTAARTQRQIYPSAARKCSCTNARSRHWWTLIDVTNARRWWGICRNRYDDIQRRWLGTNRSKSQMSSSRQRAVWKCSFQVGGPMYEGMSLLLYVEVPSKCDHILYRSAVAWINGFFSNYFFVEFSNFFSLHEGMHNFFSTVKMSNDMVGAGGEKV